jgi:4-diphosphocytidyl-2-C-methyl-D-erythritol kinase
VTRSEPGGGAKPGPKHGPSTPPPAPRTGLTARLLAHAKLNLDLHVLGLRPDGYHEIDTLLRSIDLHDTLAFREGRRPGIEIEVDDPLVPTGEENLVARAARLFERGAGIALPPLRVRIRKRIPVGAGLGGGSADAAATLFALRSLFAPAIEAGVLEGIGRELGADVPFCLAGGCARGTGRGDRLEPVEPPAERHYVIVHPGVSVSTAWAYSLWDSERLTSPAGRPRIRSTFSDPTLGGDGIRARVNDLEGLIVRFHPEIANARERLLAAGAGLALMTGSGSAVYGVFSTARRARAARAEILAEGFRVFLCRPWPRGVDARA